MMWSFWLLTFQLKIDALVGDGLVSILRQIRAGYIDRTKGQAREEKIRHRTEQYAGRTITVWGM